MKFLTLFTFFFFNFNAQAVQTPWSELSQGDKAELLYDLDITPNEDLPFGTSVVSLISERSFDLEAIKNPEHKAFAKKVLKTFDSEFDRESIEQSPYSTYGDEEVITFYLLLDSKTKEVLAGVLRVFQDGRDQDGLDNDVNWQAFFRFDQEGEAIKDENGFPYDEMRFEWSGH